MRYWKLFAFLLALAGYGIASEDDYQYQLMREKENAHRVPPTGQRPHFCDESSNDPARTDPDTDAVRECP